MKKILPSTKRQKSEDGTKINNIYKNSPSSMYLKGIKKNNIRNQIYNDSISMKNENKKSSRKIGLNKYNFDVSSDKIKINRYYKSKKRNNNSEFNKIKNIHNLSQSSSIFNKNNNNNTLITCESKGKKNLIKFFDKPIKLSIIKKNPIYKISSYDKSNFITFNYNSPKNFKSQKYFGIENKVKKFSNINLNDYIVLIQSFVRGFLLRIKLAQYLNLYENIKKAISILQYLIYERMKFVLYVILDYNINKNLFNYSYLTPSNIISFEFKKSNKNNKVNSNESFYIKNNKLNQDINIDRNKYISKLNELAEIEKELNKKKIDYVIAEKKIKELLLENKKKQNINNIIVRDNKQLALKLKNFENNRYKLEIKNINFSIISRNNKNKIKSDINRILKNIIKRKILSNKAFLSKFFYKFYYKSKLDIKNNNNNNLIIENNNFLINNNNINIKSNNIDIKKRNRKLKLLLKKKI